MPLYDPYVTPIFYASFIYQDSSIKAVHFYYAVLTQGSATFFPWVMGAAMVTKPHGSWGHTTLYNGYKSP